MDVFRSDLIPLIDSYGRMVFRQRIGKEGASMMHIEY